jgi:hypothetical protein
MTLFNFKLTSWSLPTLKS